MVGLETIKQNTGKEAPAARLHGTRESCSLILRQLGEIEAYHGRGIGSIAAAGRIRDNLGGLLEQHKWAPSALHEEVIGASIRLLGAICHVPDSFFEAIVSDAALGDLRQVALDAVESRKRARESWREPLVSEAGEGVQTQKAGSHWARRSANALT